MNIWHWRSTLIIAIFCWFWLQAFHSCAPAREDWSRDMKAQEAENARLAKIEDAKEAERVAWEEAMDYLAALGMWEAPEPELEEPWFFEEWFTEE